MSSTHSLKTWFSVTFGANERPAQLGRQQPWAVGGLYKVSQHAEDLFRPLFPKQKWPRNGDPGALQPYAPKVTENPKRGTICGSSTIGMELRQGHVSHGKMGG